MAQVSQIPTLTAPKPKQLLNDVSRAVDEALAGLAMANQGLVLLENKRVIMRRDHRQMKGKVKLISGGGSGHEPAHSGFVGAGMLTAAVVGDIFTAPPPDVILHAIRELGYLHPEGVLIIIQNYGGDRLNFGVSTERARNEGINVKMLVVGEDCVLANTSKTEGKRGMAGIVLIHKIAGAMVDAMLDLNTIFSVCRSIAMTDMATVTIALSVPSILQSSTDMRLLDNEVDLGMGINGERGIRVPMGSTAEIVDLMFEYMNKPGYNTHISLDPECPVVVLINNMGGSLKLEENVFTMETLKQFKKQGYNVVRTYCGTFLSSLEMAGFSITVFNITSPDFIMYLDAHTMAPAWPYTMCDIYQKEPTDKDKFPLYVPGCYPNDEDEDRQNSLIAGPKITKKSAQTFLQILTFVSVALITCEKQLNKYDLDGGDGDCGTSLRKGAEGIKEAIKSGRINGFRPYAALETISDVIESTVGGISGALYSIFFVAAAKNLNENYLVDASVWLEALRAGNNAVMRYGQAEVGDRSMVDALQAAVDTMEKYLAASPNNQKDALTRSAAAAKVTAENTKFMKPMVGKSSMIRSRQLEYPDPGAYAVSIWMHAISEGVKLLF